jgi:hypothetical protein
MASYSSRSCVTKGNNQLSVALRPILSHIAFTLVVCPLLLGCFDGKREVCY